MRRAGGTRHRARRTGAPWREVVERFERSGQTRGKFCAAHELALTTFDLWRRKLGATPAAVEEDHREAVCRGADEPGAGADVCYFDGDGCVGGRTRSRCRSGAAGTSDGAMWSGLSAGRIWLCTQPTDMRCARAPAERLSVRWPAQHRRRRRRRSSRPKAAPVAASRRTRRPNPGTQRRTAGFTSWIQTPGSVARLRRRTCTTYPGKRETRGDDELLCLATDPHSPVPTAAKCL